MILYAKERRNRILKTNKTLKRNKSLVVDPPIEERERIKKKNKKNNKLKEGIDRYDYGAKIGAGHFKEVFNYGREHVIMKYKKEHLDKAKKKYSTKLLSQHY